MILNDILLPLLSQSSSPLLLSGLYCSRPLKTCFVVYNRFFSLVLSVFNIVFILFSSICCFLLYWYKNDIGRIRTYAPDGNCLAGSRLNHSATMSYNIIECHKLWRITKSKLFTKVFFSKFFSIFFSFIHSLFVCLFVYLFLYFSLSSCLFIYLFIYLFICSND